MTKIIRIKALGEPERKARKPSRKLPPKRKVPRKAPLGHSI